jgi:hypothetical protein
LANHAPTARQRLSPPLDSWWNSRAVLIEARQHAGAAFRSTLMECLRAAAASGEAWAFGPCLEIRLVEEAWDLQRCLDGVIWPWGLSAAGSEARDYALWVLGKADRPPPPEARLVDRDLALEVLSRIVPSDRTLFRAVIDWARMPRDALRIWAIRGLGELIGRGEDGPPGATEASATARDSSRHSAPRHASPQLRGDDERAAVEVLHQIAGSPEDAARCTAVAALADAARVGHPSTLALLIRLGGDRNVQVRCATIIPLAGAVQAGHAASASVLRRLARDQSPVVRLLAAPLLEGLSPPGQRGRRSSSRGPRGGMLRQVATPGRMAPGVGAVTSNDLRGLWEFLIEARVYNYTQTRWVRLALANLPAEVTERFLQIGCELLLARFDDREVAGPIATMLAVFPEYWQPDFATLERLECAVLGLLDSGDASDLGVVEPLACALALRGVEGAYRRYLRTLLESARWRAADVVRARQYYGRQSVLMDAIRRHLSDPRRGALLQANDLARVLALLESDEARLTDSARSLLQQIADRLAEAGEKELARIAETLAEARGRTGSRGRS